MLLITGIFVSKLQGIRDICNCLAIKGVFELWIPVSKETSVFAVAHILSHFLRISLMYLFTEFPAFTMFAISCQKLSTRRGKLCFQNNFSLLVLLQQCNFFSFCPIWLPLRHFFYFQQSRIVTFKHTRTWMFIRTK